MSKLVRDRVLEMMNKDTPHHLASEDEYKQRLGLKLIEEAKEFESAKSEDEMKEELGDLLEVIVATAKAWGWNIADIHTIRHQKAAIKGRFERRLVLDKE